MRHIKENETSQEREPSLDSLFERFLANFGAGKTLETAEMVSEIRKWMGDSAARQKLVHERLEEEENKYPDDNERRNMYLPGWEADHKAIPKLKLELFQ